MKKLLILITMVLTASALQAQLSIGVRVGGNLANFFGSEVKEWGAALP